jgi:hypothetical protein
VRERLVNAGAILAGVLVLVALFALGAGVWALKVWIAARILFP